VNRNQTIVPVLLALASSACAGDTAVRTADATVRDSAGIRIVENADPALAPEWRLEPLPLASIGNGMGDPALELHDVTGVLLLDDGAIVVANTGTHEVRLYSPDGRTLASAGRAGEGPGEFMGEIQLARMPGDSILAFDWMLRRATVLDRRGEVSRTIDLRHLDPNVDLRGVTSDCTLILSLRHLRLSEGVNADSVVFVRTDSRGAPIDWLGWARLSRVVLRFFDGPPVVDELPFGPQGHAAATTDGLIVVDGETPEFVVRSDGGDAVTIVRWDAPPPTLTQGTIDRFIDWDLSIERAHVPRATREQWLQSIEFPATSPATASLVVDAAAGRVFIEQWRPPWAPGDAAWLVFASDGRLTARLVVPDGFDLRAVSGDLVVGLEHDALDVEHVRVYRIET
jgi:hypothetical protein